MKILLAVDGSSYTKKMLAYLATHDEMFAAHNDFTVLSVQQPLPQRARAVVGKDMVDGFHREEAERVLTPVDKFLVRHGIAAKSLWKVGNAAEVIAKTADSGKFDLLIMGSHGHSTLGGLVMGSVTTSVLAHCKTPVLIVR